MNKRGQFFLMAAIIIVGIVTGLATAVNSTKVGSKNEAFYDLSEEIGFEVKRVIDFGVVKNINIDGELRQFLSDYADYIEKEEVLFIYGDPDAINALRFSSGAIGFVGITTGGPPTFVTIQEITMAEAEVSRTVTDVTVRINEIDYVFDLRPGENFYFVIIKTEDGERFVAKG
jgi:hypothetical protein